MKKITGTIVRGKQLGRTIGFPTANLSPDFPGDILESNGVYIATLQPEGYDRPLPCMVNQGRHPTAPEGEPTIEAHVLDFSGDLYDLRAELTALAFLRSEKKFESLDALKAQLHRDLESTRAYFAKEAADEAL